MKKFTIDEVKDGLKRCVKEDCNGCPFEFLPMIECEISLLDLAHKSIESLEKLVIKSNKGRRTK